ncbi:sensor histidine kinase [Phormidium sp. CCY1219]|uniref:sensor histidine kinase n=1 Tax=Phormidium sp. CCY1219 TaxID=2886104 RepID=UPI002D796BEC|nr:HAMP domain-containing sensor histidine kinase [Phormidium sp. CCY1219]
MMSQSFMVSISQSLANKLDVILEKWKEKVREDAKIESSKNLSEPALQNLIPEVLKAMVSALDYPEDDDFEVVAQASLGHAVERAENGYDAEEIAREYRFLRQTIFSALEEDFLKLTPQQSYRAFRIIDAAIDQASAYCFQRFVKERTKKLEQIQQQLTQTNEELTRLLNLSQQSFSQLAHEFKTPLNSIMAYSQMLLRQQQGKTESDALNIDRIERVLRSSRQLLEMVNNSLELSRVEAGTATLKLIEVDVQSTLVTAIETIEPLAQKKGLELRIFSDLAPERVVTDLSRLQQILINLLSNAVRYTDDGSISISCETLPENKWLLSIRDTGIGISPEDREKIFQPFSRVGVNIAPEREGSTGLGLAIVAQLVKLLQGEIHMISEVGDGSEFSVVFPIEVSVTNPES